MPVLTSEHLNDLLYEEMHSLIDSCSTNNTALIFPFRKNIIHKNGNYVSVFPLRYCARKDAQLNALSILLKTSS
jgi:hypothetical protein